MSIEAELTALADALRAAPSALRHVSLWDGAWTRFEAQRASLATPACLVAFTGLTLDHRVLSMWAPGQLRAAAAAVLPAPQVRADLAVTFVAADPSADVRAATVLALAEAAVPVLLERGIEDVRGQNLYAPALYRAGLSAFALLGRRRIELTPPHPPRRPPAQVDAEEDGRHDRIWDAA